MEITFGNLSKGYIVFFFSSILSMVMCVVAMPNPILTQDNNESCYTLFGWKAQCSDKNLDVGVQDLTLCDPVKQRYEVAYAFVFIALLLNGMCIVGAWFSYWCEIPVLKSLAGWIGLIDFLFYLTCWALIASIATEYLCDNNNMMDAGYILSFGFGLVVACSAAMLVGSIAILAVPHEFPPSDDEVEEIGGKPGEAS